MPLTKEELQEQGVTDENGFLLPSHDAAHVNWGGTWRMPTLDDIRELYNTFENTTWEWEEVNGYGGYRITSKRNGNSIFLPAAGYRDIYANTDKTLHEEGIKGLYWTSVVYTNRYAAFNLWFDKECTNDYGTLFSYGGYHRNEGLSVRPVSK